MNRPACRRQALGGGPGEVARAHALARDPRPEAEVPGRDGTGVGIIRQLISCPPFTLSPNFRCRRILGGCVRGFRASRSASLRAAESRGGPVSSEAARHGSMSRRASAERVMSGVVAVSLPMFANKKALQSIRKLVVEPEWVTSTRRTVASAASCFRPGGPAEDRGGSRTETYGPGQAGDGVGRVRAAPSLGGGV